VYDWTYLGVGSTVHVASTDPRSPVFNAALYTAAGSSAAQQVTFAGAIFPVPAAGRVSLVVPQGLDAELDVFAREVT
jgi:hypothetical protein